MKEKKIYQIVGIILLCILVNFLGKSFAAWAKLPLWLDAVGTIMAAYCFGPVCGAIVGCASNIMYGAFSPDTYAYLLINIVVGLTAGHAIKKGMLGKSFSAFSLSMVLALFSTFCSLPLNLLLFNGKTGNLWGDSVIGYLHEQNVNIYISELMGEFYVDLLDKIVSVFIVYFIVKYYNNRKLGKKVMTAAVALMVALQSLMLGSVSIDAEESDDSSYDFSSYVQTVYNGTNGIPGGEVNDIEQTRDGILWVGTYGGLYQYDGNHFVLMSQFDSVKNVTCMFSDEEGRLWIGTNDNGLSICSSSEIVNTLDKKGGLADDSVRCISKNTEGIYYVGTVGALCLVELCDGLNVQHTISELKNVVSMAVYEGGYVACVTAAGDIALMKNEKIIAKMEAKSTGVSYTSVCFNNEGYLYAGTGAQTVDILKLDVEKNTISKVNTCSCPGMVSINDIYYSSDVYMICSDTGIGYINKNGQFAEITTGSFNSSIDNILVDYQGNYWFTSSRLGLLKLSPSIFEEISSHLNAKEDVVNAVTKWNDQFYYGTDSGLVVSDSEFKGEVKNKLTELLDGIRIRCLKVDNNNHLWIATYKIGAIEVIDENNYVIYNSKSGLSSDKVRTITQLKDGTIVCGTVNGISYIKNGEVTGSVGTADGLSNSVVLCVLEHNGMLYVGTDGGGINVIYDKKIVRVITKDEKLSSNIILRMVEVSDTEGILVIAGTGLDYYNEDGDVKNLKSFPYYNNFDAFITDDGKVWVISSAGIYIVDKEALLSDGIKDYELLDSRKGLRQRFTANSWNYLDNDNNLYLCGDTGVVTINLKKYDNQKTSYRFTLESIAIDGVMVSVDKEDTNTIARNATKIEFYPKIVNYSVNDPYVGVWLEGFDTEPMICLQSELESIVYTNLTSGEYIFHLAIYDGSQENILEEVTYRFIKEKEFYDNWWFVIYMFSIFAIILIYLVWLIVGSQINKSMQIQKKELENLKLKQDSDAIVAASEAKDKFLALMSHDIRTPINAILGMNEMILRESKEEEIYDYANDIKGAGNTLLTLVNSILDFSKIEEGKMEIIPVEYESRMLINNLVNGVKTRADDKKLEFRIDIDKRIPSVMYGDDVRVTQVISNLLTNAVKYTEKGFISLAIKEYFRKDDTVGLFVEVKDSGIGIKQEDMGRLFESFQRLDEERNRNVEGTGLGMSIVTNLLAMMDSKLDVSSEYGVGTTFSFKLDQKIVSSEPMGDYEHVSSSSKEKEAETHIYAPKAKLLVVDDNDMNLKVIKSLLKINGIVPDLVCSGREALEHASKNHYDIIFLDHMMPDMDGIETLQRLRNDKLIGEDTKVVILTANAIIGAKEQYLKSGFDDYLSKPIVVASLEEKLSKYLPEGIIEKANLEVEAERNSEAPKNEEEVSEGGVAGVLKKHCPEINSQIALEYCINSWDFYIKVLKEYVKGIKVTQLNGFFDAEDFENYRIVIHAVKSNSMSIGAIELSQKAKDLEHACSEGNYDFVKKNHRQTMDEYQNLTDRVAEFIKEMEA